jgi:hypothetical protein
MKKIRLPSKVLMDKWDEHFQTATVETVSFALLNDADFFWMLIYPAQDNDEIDALVSIALRERTEAGFRKMLKSARAALLDIDPMHTDSVRLMKCMLRVTEGWQKALPSTSGQK